jgi:serine/threonine protein kinase
MYARQSSEHYHWRIIENRVHTEGAASTVYDQLSFPVRTEMAFELSGATFPIDMSLASTGDIAVENARGCFLVALSVEKIEFKPYKLKFLSGLAVAIFVAAFDLDADDDRETQEITSAGDGYSHLLDDSGLDARDTHEGLERRFSSDTGVLPLLDFVSVSVPPTPSNKSISVASTPLSPLVPLPSSSTNRTVDDSSANSVQLGDNVNLLSTISSGVTALPVEDHMAKNNFSFANDSLAATKRPFSSIEPVGNSNDPSTMVDTEDASINDNEDNSVSDTNSQKNSTNHQIQGPPLFTPIPSWDPARTFHFPIVDIPIKYPLDSIPRDLVLASSTVCGEWEYYFTDISHIADGSHAHIYLATLNRTPIPTKTSASVINTARPMSSRVLNQSQRCVVKMLTENALRERVACQEFAIEFGTLARVQHPHIIRLLGAGNAPRPFVVLEHLSGGTLYKILNATQQTWGSASGLQRLFRKPSFTYSALLKTALALAEACDYLHHRVHPGAMILHRDLKPDNIGFSADGTLKLFDFGLSACVRTRRQLDEAYEMTGYTGSLRYMAPEVVQRLPYTEACDVYSYAIVLWQMARDRVPFKGLSKEDFIQRVVKQQERPKLDRAWPSTFSSLLQRCWHPDQKQRPSFSVVMLELRGLILQQEGGLMSGSGSNNSSSKESGGTANTKHRSIGGLSGSSSSLSANAAISGFAPHGHDWHATSTHTSGTTTPTSLQSYPLQSTAAGSSTPKIGQSPTANGGSQIHSKIGIAATTDQAIPGNGSTVRRGRIIGAMGSAVGGNSAHFSKASPSTSSWF